MGEAKTKDPYGSIRLDNQLCFPLYACAKELIRQYRKPLEKLDLTYTQYIVMMALWEHGSMAVGELGEKVHLDSGTLTPLLKRLEKLGLIRRVRPEDNERKRMLLLTEEGSALREKALEVPCEIKKCLNLSPGEMQELKKLLEKALSGMEDGRKDMV